jgi:hypothetical protein
VLRTLQSKAGHIVDADVVLMMRDMTGKFVWRTSSVVATHVSERCCILRPLLACSALSARHVCCDLAPLSSAVKAAPEISSPADCAPFLIFAIDR